MRISNARPNSLKRLRVLHLLVTLLMLSAAVVLPVYSARSTSSSYRTLSPVGFAASDILRRFDSGAKSSSLKTLTSMVAGESVATYAADCTTPKSVFIFGETVCAKTDGVSLSPPGNYYMNWIDSQLNQTNGGTITQNPQFFLFNPPAAGTYKATIGSVSPADSSIVGNPPIFTVEPGIGTYDATCTTPKTSFVLGDTVCARAYGLSGFRFAWIDPAGFIRRRTDITTSPQDDTFGVPATQTSTIDGFFVVDNRGDWRVNAITSRGSSRTGTFFTVKDPQNAAADVSIFKTNITDSPTAGNPVQYEVTIKNYGPDDAVNVHFVDDTFSGGTFNSVTQTSGPSFTCTGTGSADCTIALLANGAVAKFTVVLTAGSAGSTLNNKATVTSDTTELNTGDNTSEAAPLPIATGNGGGNGTCTVACPDDIQTPANTTDGGGNPGAVVHFSPPSGNLACGTITVDHCNDCFFPEGSTVVTGTSETGDSCSFTVTVTAAGTGTTVSCPANKTANADSNCSAVVSVGTATATGTNVTVIGFRSDGELMYTCDEFGNCTRNSSDAPFNAGTTTITWFAYSHDTPGPYTAVTGDEESHRSGSASCSQTVVVNDVTPPTITAVDQTVSADANCQAMIPDYSNSATDNCACANSDPSEVCQDRGKIVVTQDVAAGTAVTLGTTTIHLTATDEANNSSTKTVTFTVVDTTPPTFTFVPGAITAYTGPGATTCNTVVDPGTATAADNCGPVTITRSPSGNTFGVGTTTITWTAKDGANNTTTATQTVTVIDNTPPVISCPANIVVYLPLNTTATSMPVSFSVTAQDNCGTANVVSTPASGSTFSVGATTVNSTATDAAGNTSSCSFTVTVLYDFTGFFSPVGNPPVLNVVNAGRAIPLKFSLSGNKGLNIFAPNNPYSVSINCNTNDPGVDVTETLTAGGSSLSYDSSSDQYNYVWKTDSSWAGTCRQLVVTLNDGSVHVANFKFR